MAVLDLGFTSEDADSVYQIPLDGDLFTFRIRYNEYTNGWYMDLFDGQDEPIKLGARLVPGLCPVPTDRGPKGALYVYGSTRSDQEYEILGRELFVYYFEESTTFEEMQTLGVIL